MFVGSAQRMKLRNGIVCAVTLPRRNEKASRRRRRCRCRCRSENFQCDRVKIDEDERGETIGKKHSQQL